MWFPTQVGFFHDHFSHCSWFPSSCPAASSQATLWLRGWSFSCPQHRAQRPERSREATVASSTPGCVQKQHSFGEHSQQGVTSLGLTLSSPWEMETHVFPLPGAFCVIAALVRHSKYKVRPGEGRVEPQPFGLLQPSRIPLTSVLPTPTFEAALSLFCCSSLSREVPCSETWMHKGFWRPKLNIIHFPDSMLIWDGAEEVWIMQFWSPPNNLDLFQHLQVFGSALPNQFDCDTAAIPCWTGTGYNECLPKVQRWFDGAHLWSIKWYVTCKTSLTKCF